MKKMVLGLMVVAGLLGTSTVVTNAADTGGVSTGDVSFSSGGLSMSVDSVPLSFGQSKISADTATLKASKSPTVTVSDLRGNNSGWSLTVAQGQQFNTKTDASGSELTDAALTVLGTNNSSESHFSSDSTVNTDNTPLHPGTTQTNGPAKTVASASAGHGNGISQFNFGSSTLNIPITTAKLAQEYTTTLTWNLTDAPSNSK